MNLFGGKPTREQITAMRPLLTAGTDTYRSPLSGGILSSNHVKYSLKDLAKAERDATLPYMLKLDKNGFDIINDILNT